MKRAGFRRRARRGFALADFVAGTLIFTGTLLAFSALTRAKFDLLESAQLRGRALSAAEAELDRVRRDGVAERPRGQADRFGFRELRRFVPERAKAEPRLPRGEGLVEARALRMDGGGDARGLYEVRVTVRWEGSAAVSGQVSLSTLTELGEPR